MEFKLESVLEKTNEERKEMLSVSMYPELHAHRLAIVEIKGLFDSFSGNSEELNGKIKSIVDECLSVVSGKDITRKFEG